MACMAYKIGASIRACALRSPSRGGSKLSIAWIRGPFLGPDGSASLAGFNSRLVSTKKKFSILFALCPLGDQRRYDWLLTLANMLA